MNHNLYESLQEFSFGTGKTGRYYSLAALEQAGVAKVARLPVSARVGVGRPVRNLCDRCMPVGRA